MYTKMIFLIVAILIATSHTVQGKEGSPIADINYRKADELHEAMDCSRSTSSARASGTPVRNLPHGKPLNILLLGKTGHGKSATANSIFGEERFESYMSSSPVTTKCHKEIGIIGGRKISLVDTPGTMENVLKEIRTAFTLLPRGFDGFVIVLRIDLRITQEEKMVITMLKNMFGQDVLLKHGVLVFTHGDIFMKISKTTFKEYIKSQKGDIKNILEEFSYHCALIDNSEKDSSILRDQVIEIITLIDQLVGTDDLKWERQEALDAITKEAKKYAEDEIQKIKDEYEKQKRLDERKRQEEIDAIKKELKKYAEDEIHKIKNEIEHKNKVETAGNPIAHCCFTPDALVTLDDGRTIYIAEVSIGHNVLSAAASGTLKYSEVYFAHLNPNVITEYINLKSSKQYLKLTPEHYISVVRNGLVITVAAREVQISDSMIVLNKETSSLVEESVTEISKSTEVGVYAATTKSGTIIVNNVLVSCYVRPRDFLSFDIISILLIFIFISLCCRQ